MFKVGEVVKWRCPLDPDYSYGTIVKVRPNSALIECTGYYKGLITGVPKMYIEKLKGGGEGFGRRKGCNK